MKLIAPINVNKKPSWKKYKYLDRVRIYVRDNYEIICIKCLVMFDDGIDYLLLPLIWGDDTTLNNDYLDLYNYHPWTSDTELFRGFFQLKNRKDIAKATDQKYHKMYVTFIPYSFIVDIKCEKCQINTISPADEDFGPTGQIGLTSGGESYGPKGPMGSIVYTGI